MNNTSNQIKNIACSTATWTKYQNQWCVSVSRKLTDADAVTEEHSEMFTDKKTSVRITYVEAVSRSGNREVVRIGEYEHCFKNDDGSEFHIYSVS